ncbi:MAG: hypothetical protein ACT4PJ_01965 [Gemmatimonadaceae bacterium]
MTRPSPRRTPRRSSGSERLFSDTAGRLWSAAYSRTQEAIVFSCLSDARQPTRAIAPPARFRLSEASDDELRDLLKEAPSVGRLT